LGDPRAQAAGVRGDLVDHRNLTSERYDPSQVDRSHERYRGDASTFRDGARSDTREQKRDHYAQILREQATLPRSYPQIAADEVGGLVTGLLESGALARAGLGGLFSEGLGDVRTFADTLSETGSVEEALRAAGSGWQKGRDLLIETRMDQVRGYGLTDAQMDYYRAAINDLLPGGVESDTARAREALMRQDGPTGAHIADLLERSVVSHDDTYLRTIGAYNRADTGVTPVPPPLSQNSVTGGSPGALLDLIAAPESRGNYDAWYGNAEQDRLDLAGLTVNEIRDLQSDLVRSNGGSAIGRYQFLDDTFDGLVNRMGLTGHERFTPELQDQMALLLARDAGMEGWEGGRISDERFARNLSEIWAGLPRDASNQSHYEGLQGNQATVDWNTVVGTLRDIRRRPS
jgi:conjugal transfer mating pair stabilization protein TraG